MGSQFTDLNAFTGAVQVSASEVLSSVLMLTLSADEPPPCCHTHPDCSSLQVARSICSAPPPKRQQVMTVKKRCEYVCVHVFMKKHHKQGVATNKRLFAIKKMWTGCIWHVYILQQKMAHMELKQSLNQLIIWIVDHESFFNKCIVIIGIYRLQFCKCSDLVKSDIHVSKCYENN